MNLFEISKDIIEDAIEDTSRNPATDLDLSLAALSENTCFLDLLEEENII